MKLQNLATNAGELSRSFVRPDAPEKNRKNVPTLDEIHRRAREIHVERGDHGCDLDNYLDEWLQAKLELQEKCNSTGAGALKGNLDERRN